MTMIATKLLEARAAITDTNNKKFELKSNRTNITEGFLKYSDQAFPNLAELRSSTKRATKATYISRTDFSLGSAKSCSPSGTAASSAIVALEWLQKTFTVQVSEKVHFGNEITAQTALQSALFQAEINALWKGSTGVDAALAAFLNTNRTQVNATSDGSGQSTWDSVNYISKFAAADKDDFYTYLAGEMELNGYDPMYQEFCDTMWAAAQTRIIKAQGAGNDTNTAYQFDGSFETSRSNLITKDTYYQSKHFIVPTGGVSMVTWNDPLNRKLNGTPQDNATGVYGLYESILYPGVYFDTFSKKSCADTTAAGGDVQDQTWDIEMTLNYAPAVMPMSESGLTPIFKVGILAS